ncbi:zona pellucida sperm-binding protein 3 [Hippoglossus hippoglossus]|uniref:zona pellucida sperm-binding protein 3 n=1 Tax=Hippoglossus hippoglossus TaxID=8267 RepID=UPI00148D83C3|nr:zona pellucida sperm-binding protein 3 [Hippoglossus hippoglossus]
MTQAWVLLLLFCSAYSYQFSSGTRRGLRVRDPEAEWDRLATIMGEETKVASVPSIWKSSTGPGSLKANKDNFPQFKLISMSKYPKDAFKPEKGVRPLPGFAGEILVVPSTTGTAATSPARKPAVEILCHLDRIYVRVLREGFNNVTAYKDLYVGSCPVNQGTEEHYYFLYRLTTDCKFKEESLPDYLSYSNVLSYNPSGQILRKLPFVLPVQCKYHRLFHSYKVGFYPKLQGGTVFKALTPKQSVVLEAQDASGNELTGSKTYTLGQPMFFEAKKANDAGTSGAQWMYINKCFMTADQSPNSNPKYTIIENQGCMIDSKFASQSKFLRGSSKMSQKFQVVSFVFKDQVSTSSMSQQLYMHCDVTLGPLTASYKACNYDSATKKWKALYGDDSVCTCCETNCPSPLPKVSKKTISSASWKVNLGDQDGHVNVEPRMRLTDADSFSLEDSDMADFLNYWEDDY